MIASVAVRSLCAAAVACLVLAQDARAQQQPAPAAVAIAKQIMEIKGGISMFDPVLTGVVEHNKALLLQVNPNLQNDLNEVSAKLRSEIEVRKADIHTEIARAYAMQFTEQELKDALTFYRSPLGKKLTEAEPKAFDEAAKRVDAWAGKFAEEVASKMRAEMRRKGHSL